MEDVDDHWLHFCSHPSSNDFLSIKKNIKSLAWEKRGWKQKTEQWNEIFNILRGEINTFSFLYWLTFLFLINGGEMWKVFQNSPTQLHLLLSSWFQCQSTWFMFLQPFPEQSCKQNCTTNYRTFSFINVCENALTKSINLIKVLIKHTLDARVENTESLKLMHFTAM